MGNPYFQFKQFRIGQEASAMKVTTDACIQGAWTPISAGAATALDIGAGTGLLALMLAQRNATISIDAIEAEPTAWLEARNNIAQSPWYERINMLEGDVRKFSFARRYDLVICNPPFFMKSLLGPDDKKNAARHTLSLSFEELLEAIGGCLAEDGYASVLLPTTEYLQWQALMRTSGWHEVGKLHIIHRADGAAKRIVGLWSRVSQQIAPEQTLLIREDEKNYSADFKELLGPFYLDL